MIVREDTLEAYRFMRCKRGWQKGNADEGRTWTKVRKRGKVEGEDRIG